MKLSEADFRPKQRSRHVPSAPKRKIPLLRIFVLVLAAALVYKGVDSFWPGGRGAKNQTSIPGEGKDATIWRVSKDSTRAVLSCGRAPETECCEALDSLRSGLCGDARAAIQKARWMGSLSLPRASRFEVKLQSGPAMLVSIQGFDHARSFRYQRAQELDNTGKNTFGPWCDSTGACLTAIAARVPLVQGVITLSNTETNPESHWDSPIPEVFALYPGRVIRVDSLGPERYRLVLYHGKELYTTYEPLRRVASDLKVGMRVNSHGIVGMAIADSLAAVDSKHSLRLSIEQGGMSLDAEYLFADVQRESNGP